MKPRALLRFLLARVDFLAEKHIRSRFRRVDIAVFHQFATPPSGGGHQFMRALLVELRRRGYRIAENSFSRTSSPCLANSFNFDFDRLASLRPSGCRLVHRVDGPLSVYRGWDDGSDERVFRFNQRHAQATIFQSQYSLLKHAELGFRFQSPVVIPNAADPRIFNPHGKIPFERGRKIRLVSVSWSDNPNKGLETFLWLDDNLDWTRYEYLFIGRIKASLLHFNVIQPVNPEKVASLLRQQDIYIAASRNDPCSNALIEGLSCGLPALFLDSGGHPELVREAGLAFDSPSQIPGLLEDLASNYDKFQNHIQVASIQEVADRYLEVLGINPARE